MIRASRFELVYRHELHRTTTPEDLNKDAGGREFRDLLVKYKWISSDNIAIRGFTIYPPEKGPDYIEWRVSVPMA